jgi:hypothetical protein
MSTQTQSDQSISPTDRSARRGRRGSGGLGAGVVLIFIGAVFMFQQMGILEQGFNWWAIFILLPAFGTLSAAWALYRRSERFDAGVRSTLGSGLVILTVALMFLFDFDWGTWWPLMLIAPGVALLLNSLPEPGGLLNPYIGRWLNLGIWCSLSVIGLGLAFLLQNLDVVSYRSLFGNFQWWGIFVLIPGIGALFNALLAYRGNGNQMSWTSQSLLIIGLAICSVAVLSLLGLNWNLLTPLLLILLGLALLLGIFGRRQAA